MSAHTPGPWTLTWRPIIDVAGIASVPVSDDGRHTANAYLIAAAPDLLAEIEREYAELSNVHNSWPGRDTPSGQMKLGRLRDLIAKATGRSEQDVQDDYGNRGTP